MKKTKTKEVIENLMDEFNFIECHEFEDQYCRDKYFKPTKKRIRDLKNEAESAINHVIEQIENLEKNGKSKFNFLALSMVNSFLCIGYYAEEMEIDGDTYPEGYKLTLSYSQIITDHLTY